MSPAAVCFTSAAADTGDAGTSQNFESANDAFDTQIAGDFKCRGTGTFTIKKVSVIGQYTLDGGPADSVNVTIYKNQGGEPGDVLCRNRNQAYTNGPSFEVVLATPCAVAKGKTYWVEVQANMDFTNGQWFWELGTPSDMKGADFRNKGDGFGTGCTTYPNDLYLNDCIPGLPGPEVLFTVSGRG